MNFIRVDCIIRLMNGYTNYYSIRIIVLIVMLAVIFPLQFAYIAGLAVVVWLIYSKVVKPKHEKSLLDASSAGQRREALRLAQPYLSPYKNIWGNLRLSNKYCSISISTEKVIIAIEKVPDGSRVCRTFRVISNSIYSMDTVWDLICRNFGSTTTYDGLMNSCRLFKCQLLEDIIPQLDSKKEKVQKNKKNNPVVEKLDVNNCSEVEITALPGISIVLSKKIIKKREEIGGFKNIDEFFVFINLKPHLEAQLRNQVCVKKMRGSISIKKYEERSVDL